MTKDISQHRAGKEVAYDNDGLHFTELMTIALDNPEIFDIIEKMIMNDIPVERILKIIRKVM